LIEEDVEKIQYTIVNYQPNILVCDFTAPNFGIAKLNTIMKNNPSLAILCITQPTTKNTLLEVLQIGVKSYLLKDCSSEEIVDALKATKNGENFFCANVLDIILNEDKNIEKTSTLNNCEALKISNREIEIIQLIAEGLANKEIADKLNLSLHTVNTHRKNIMYKTGAKNTAGLVVFAVKEGILNHNHFLFN
jgi:DNA-binding NarL/FixJ family response regulator